MPLIREVPVILSSSQFSHETHKRSAGYHVSTIIKSYFEDTLKMFNEIRDDDDGQGLEAYRIGGFLFERALYDILLQDELIQRIGEVIHDGIVLTPDAINLSRSRGIESKCTWQSMNKEGGVEDVRGAFASWWMQIMSYGEALGMTSWDLYVYFINGGYGKERQPRMRHWEIEFSTNELKDNWRRIKNHEAWMRESGRFDSNGQRLKLS